MTGVIRRFHSRLSRAAFESFRRHSGDAGATHTGAQCAAFALVLAQWAAEPRFTLNMTVDNRWPFHPDVANLVGDFTGTLLVDFDLGEAATFRDLVRSSQRRILDGLQHRLFTGVEVLRELSRRSKGVGHALMPYVFTSIAAGDEGTPASEADIRGDLAYIVTQTPQVLIDNISMVIEGELHINWDVCVDAFPSGMPQDMLDTYVAFLERLASEPDAWGHPL